MGYPFITTPTVVVQALLFNPLLRTNISFVLFWTVYIYIWVFYICSGKLSNKSIQVFHCWYRCCLSSTIAAYGLPIFISVVARYIQVKQASVLNDMSHLSRTLCKYKLRVMKALHLNYHRWIWHRLIRLQRRYGSIQDELLHYTHLVARCLNIIFAVYIAMICYITYLLFFTETSFQFKLLYSQIYALNILLLTLLIMSCSAFTRHSPQMRLLVIQFYIQCAKKRLLGVRDLLQVFSSKFEI